MFCPKCGQQNPDNGKFCRSCGTDLGNVSAALSVPEQGRSLSSSSKGRRGRHEDLPSSDSAVFGHGLRSTLMGIGFLVISAVLFFTNVAGGSKWWWAMLFPAFTMLARGLSDVIRYRMASGGSLSGQKQDGPTAFPVHSEPALPPQRFEPARPESVYKTGDLVPPSVTDHTTRHLEMDSEGKTMTLPKQ